MNAASGALLSLDPGLTCQLAKYFGHYSLFKLKLYRFQKRAEYFAKFSSLLHYFVFKSSVVMKQVLLSDSDVFLALEHQKCLKYDTRLH